MAETRLNSMETLHKVILPPNEAVYLVFIMNKENLPLQENISDGRSTTREVAVNRRPSVDYTVLNTVHRAHF